MKDGATKSFVQAYNAQAAVDGAAQIIVAAVTQEADDKQLLVPMLTRVVANCGETPAVASADSGYFSEAAATADAVAAIDLYVAPGRQKHGEDVSAPVLDDGAVIGTMRTKLQTAGGRVVYAPRKAIAEPAFGQIKDARHFRRFSFCGLVRVRAEWLPICPTHNLLKLFRVGWTPHPA